MGRRLPHTPSSQIRGGLRQIWMRSRERAAALKRSGYCCEQCGIKQSKAKGRECTLEVHHVLGDAGLAEIEALIRKLLLCYPEILMVLCKKCHKERHKGGQ